MAVSGGVDSVVMLHKIVAAKPEHATTRSAHFVVAHFDHGIRADSASDAEFVRSLAEEYGLVFELGEGKLGANASEETARNARYEFLRKLKDKYSAEFIVTAHHQDDILETMIVNMLRGTGPRGLIGYTQSGILRPLINKSKNDILEYAKTHTLAWREDSTNQDDKYLRNYVRHNILPKLTQKRFELLEIRRNMILLYSEIDDLSSKLLVSCMKKRELKRARFVTLPYAVQIKIISHWLRLEGINLERKHIDRSVVAVKTMLPNKSFPLRSGATLEIKRHTIVLKIDTRHV